MRFGYTVFWITLTFATPLWAEPYRMIQGDRISLFYSTIAEAKISSIDLDGNIRLADLGTVLATGKTLDELETEVSKALTASGFNGTPLVTVEIVEYAPVTVSGYVPRGGIVPFSSGMTVGTVIGAAGPASAADTNRIGADVALLSVRRRAAALSAQIADVVARIARFEAALAGPDSQVTLTEELRKQVPGTDTDRLDLLTEAEAALLRIERDTSRKLIASWEQEVTDSITQIKVLDDRSVLKEEVIVQLTQDLEAQRSLNSEGLGTNAQMSTIVQRLGDEREDQLALVSAKLTAQRARALAERSRLQFKSDQETQWQTGLNDARSQLHQLTNEYNLTIDDIAVLQGSTGTIMLDASFNPQFKLFGPRAARIAPEAIDENTPLLPGDILFVTAPANPG